MGDENFEFLQTTIFTVPDEAPPTDTSLTDPPTISPTLSPTESPSAAPTVSRIATGVPLDNETENMGDGISDADIVGDGDDTDMTGSGGDLSSNATNSFRDDEDDSASSLTSTFLAVSMT